MRVSLSRSKPALLAALLLSASALSACDTMSEAMGIGKLPPDEYAVAPRRPLAMPPDMELRAPQPGAPATADINAPSVAAQALSTSGQDASKTPSAEPPPPTDGAGRVMTTTPPPPSGQ
ncbi:hypothetical protein sos41_34580 [Alphaproteobacteria bacterium SO-S41]|nr:hypothetical protein sos41_34580 [Alphaproteobacteria bacterium SO-S41]